MTLEKYLRNKYSRGTAKVYLLDIMHYLDRNPEAERATYAEILDYFSELRSEKSEGSMFRILQSIKKYYDYLLQEKKRMDHPCKSLSFRNHQSRDVQVQDLFSEIELESLLVRKNRYPLLARRNELILSLLINQGLTTGELIQLETRDLNLEKGSIYLRESRRLNGRTLALASHQILLAHRYLQEDRVLLLGQSSDQLLITQRGSAEKGEGISYLISTLQSRFPQRKLNPKTIRQSVITNLLKEGKSLRWVQLFAGHKYPSSTERYRQTNLDNLKETIWKHHPLG